MRRSFLSLIFLGAFSATEAGATTGKATVVVLRGSAKTEAGKALAVQDTVSPGTTVITGPRSFVRLVFSDQTQMSLGPDTTMKLEPTKPGETSIVDLVGGQLRAKVTKDPLRKSEGGDSAEKMVVKTKTAAMGIRGTDFNVTFNRQNFITALVTFEGNVAMARMERGANPFSALRSNGGVQSVGAGQFSGAQPDMAMASIPVKISPAQLESLKGNDSFQGVGEKSSQKVTAMASPVPPGIDPKAFSSGADKHAREAVAKAAGAESVRVLAEARQAAPAGDQPPPEGFLNKQTGEYAPRAGGFIDLNTGRYVPPPPGSSFDPNTGVYVPPRAMGSVDPVTGMYVPPKGVELDAVKGFVAETPAAGSPGSPGAAPAPASAGAPPPPPTAVQALVVALNTATSPELAGAAVSFDATFVPTGDTSGAFVPPPPPPPPPPGSTTLPPPPPPDQPVYDTYCPTCQQDNVAPPPPTSSTVNFRFSVQ